MPLGRKQEDLLHQSHVAPPLIRSAEPSDSHRHLRLVTYLEVARRVHTQVRFQLVPRHCWLSCSLVVQLPIQCLSADLNSK